MTKETEENFGTKLRTFRDGKATSQDSWRFRHGHTFVGSTVHLYALVPFSEFNQEDLEWMLIHAASLPFSTDIQVHFTKESGHEFSLEDTISNFCTELIKSGFQPVSMTLRCTEQGRGWMRVALFPTQDLPASPYESMASA